MNDQRSLSDQIADLLAIADERGMYDASDWLREAFQKEFVRGLQNSLSKPRAKRRCAIDGCGDRVYAAHFYCTMHRLRMERTGDPRMVRKRGRKPKAGA